MADLPAIVSSELPDNYNPVEGLQKIAAGESAETFWRRAKDSTKLWEAVEAKMTEQRNLVIWWHHQEKDKGGYAPNYARRGPATGILRADLPIDKDTLHRWTIRLKDARKFEKSLLAAQERCRRTCEAEKGSTDQKGATGTGENEWHTPVEYMEMARAVLGVIDLDPASTPQAQKVVRATKFFTKKDKALDRPWNGRIWLNPPYAQPWIADFITKLVREVRSAHVKTAILLTHNYTDTSWFHEAASVCSAICFTRGRVKFVSPEGELAAPTQGQAFFYFGSRVDDFQSVFKSTGLVVVPYEHV